MAFAGVDVGIDAAAKQIVEIRIERRPVENSAADLVPRKGRQMTDIKNKRMAPNDRLRQNLPVPTMAKISSERDHAATNLSETIGRSLPLLFNGSAISRTSIKLYTK